ncbi:UNVERIFIED_CONTAM: hypothetical protein Slati_3952800 [Sesamum latifolium]|uniref:Uncharacterized protein n=1 Tax=Sesamum latifolium TaxID=2727402 RepID=A0AAW2TP52_9LAMI
MPRQQLRRRCPRTKGSGPSRMEGSAPAALRRNPPSLDSPSGMLTKGTSGHLVSSHGSAFGGTLWRPFYLRVHDG